LEQYNTHLVVRMSQLLVLQTSFMASMLQWMVSLPYGMVRLNY